MNVFAAVLLFVALRLGDKLPAGDVKMKNAVDGRELSLTDVAGKHGTLLLFTCNQCPFARAWESRFVEMGDFCQRNGFGMIAINSNDPNGQTRESAGRMQQRAKQAGYTFPYVVDATSDVARAFGAKATPELFLFDAAGKLVYHGAFDDNKDAHLAKQRYVKDAMESLLADREIAVKETKVPGCAIRLRPR